MNWNLKGGVIIIGSLLWQDYLDIEGDNIRLNWRNSHLDLEKRIPVKVPIRYGRKSNSNIVTMVFSNRMKRKKGFGYVVPLKRRINNQDELMCETVSLATAEGMRGSFVRDWGVLTYLFNKPRISPSHKNEITTFFRKRKNSNFDIKDYKVGRERSCVTKSLKLDIDWIEPVSGNNKKEINEYDFLLATATKPYNSIITIEEIADSIKLDKKRRYFINNLTNGIITYDDFEISKLI